jgi:hypothetical protein
LDALHLETQIPHEAHRRSEGALVCQEASHGLDSVDLLLFHKGLSVANTS